jgi:ATP-dependent Clp protease adapter protein ClpS
MNTTKHVTLRNGIVGESEILKRIFGNQPAAPDDGGIAVMDAPPVLKPEEVIKPELPPMYAILLHNDQSTNPDFVVRVLREAFSVEKQLASRIMMAVHMGERGVVKIVAKDIAETQLEIANGLIAGAQVRRDFYSPGMDGRPVVACALQFTMELESGSDGAK